MKKTIVILSMIFLSIISGCSTENTKSPQTLNLKIINEYLEKDSIDPLDMVIKENSALVLYKKNGAVGIYSLNIDDNGLISSIRSSAVVSTKEPVHVAFLSGVNAYVTVVFEDAEIKKNARRIIVGYNNGEDEREVSGQEGIIIMNSLNKNILVKNIKILDVNGKEIFGKKL